MTIIPAAATAVATGHYDTPTTVPAGFVRDTAATSRPVTQELARVLRVAVNGALHALPYPSVTPQQIILVFQDDSGSARRGDSKDAEITRRLLTHGLVELAAVVCRRDACGELVDLAPVRITEDGWRWLSRHSQLAPADGLGRMDTSPSGGNGTPRWRSASWSGVRSSRCP